MKKLLLAFSLLFSLNYFAPLMVYAKDVDYNDFLNKVADNRAGEKLSTSYTTADGGIVTGIPALLINIGKNVMIPIVIALALIIAFIGFYKLFFSDKADDQKKGMNYFIWGTIGVVLMSSAWFITNTLFGTTGTSGILGISAGSSYDPATIANNLYANIFSKFFYLVMYLVVGILFVVLVINVIKLISAGDKEDMTKHAKTIIVWNSLGIILILFSKQIISLFYTKVAAGTTSLAQQGAILTNKSLPWFYTILNYFLGFIAFAITVFIIYQAFLLLFKPDDDATYKNLKKYFVYSILGVLLIGGVYIIANFLIVK